ncbi:MAG: hypothetical protein PHW50_02960 [Patescibacteria group bacterium]|nr:hypothetical protein [Patescibacteria group bacterium]
MTTMPEVVRISVGDEIAILSAEVLLLTGEVFSSSCPLELGQKLIETYEHEQPGEVQKDKCFLRTGYQSISFTHQVNEHQFALVFLQPETPELKYPSYKWPDLDGPEVEGEHNCFWGWEENFFDCPCLTLPGKGGKELGEFIQKLATEEVTILILQQSCRQFMPLAHDDFVVLQLQPGEEIIGQGTISLLQSHSRGYLYRTLYDREGGNTLGGRGDHPGCYYTRDARKRMY